MSKKDMTTLSEDSAIKEMQTFLDYYEIERDELEDEDLKKAYDLSVPGFIKAIRKGFVTFEVNDDVEIGFCIVQKLKSGNVLTYRELNGTAKLAMSSIPSSDFTRKTYTLLGKLSGEGIEVIKKLRGPDLKRAEVISQMLLLC